MEIQKRYRFNAITTLSLSVLKTVLLVMILCFSISYLSLGQSQTFFVNPDNGNDENDGSFSDPLKTLTHTMDLASPGDTIVLRAGIYYEEHDPHLWVPEPPGYTICNLGQPEDFPIYLKQDVTIKAYEPTPGVYEEVILTTELNCNQDILRPYIKQNPQDVLSQWTQSSDAETSKIIGIQFRSKLDIPLPGALWHGSG